MQLNLDLGAARSLVVPGKPGTHGARAGRGYARCVQRPTSRRRPFFITSCGLNMTTVILERSEESPGCHTPTPAPDLGPFGLPLKTTRPGRQPLSSFRTPIRNPGARGDAQNTFASLLKRTRAASDRHPVSTIFITSCGLNKTAVILERSEESPGCHTPTSTGHIRAPGIPSSSKSGPVRRPFPLSSFRT